MKDNFDHCLSNHDKCSDEIKFLPSTLAIPMNGIAKSNGSYSNMFESDSNGMSTQNNVAETMKKIVSTCKNSFLPAQNSFTLIGNSACTVICPSLNNKKRSPKHRLIPDREMRRKALKVNASKTGAASSSMNAARKNAISSLAHSFCARKEKGDNIKKCKKRKELCAKSCECVLGVTERGFYHLCRQLEHGKPFKKPLKVGNLLISAPAGKGGHVFIHDVWSDSLHPNMTMRDVRFEISFIRKLGSIDSDHYQATGQRLNEMTPSLNTLQTKTHDGTINECMTLPNNE